MTYNNDQKIFVSAILHNRNGEILLIRSTRMRESLDDAEYFNIPSWSVPFGVDPQEKIVHELETLLEDVVEIGLVRSIQSYVQHNHRVHVIELVYEARTSAEACREAGRCSSLRFVSEQDIDAYIFSSRIKELLSNEF